MMTFPTAESVLEEQGRDRGRIEDLLESEPLFMRCRKCGGSMKQGKALVDIYGGTPDFTGDTIVTMSPTGKAELVDCLKCEACGHSVTTTESNCDHDWEDIGGGQQQCTYPECQKIKTV